MPLLLKSKMAASRGLAAISDFNTPRNLSSPFKKLFFTLKHSSSWQDSTQPPTLNMRTFGEPNSIHARSLRKGVYSMTVMHR